MSNPIRFAGPLLFAAVLTTAGRSQSTIDVSGVVHLSPPPVNPSVATPTISPDGRWITFEYYFDIALFVYEDDVFRYDVTTGNYSLGTQSTHAYQISPVAGNTNFAWYVDDAAFPSIWLSGLGVVSVTPTGGYASAVPLPALSRDEQCVAFASDATTIVVGDVNQARDVFVRDVINATSYLVSVDSNGIQGNQASADPSLSADGRFVAFDSLATNLAAGYAVGLSGVFVRDRLLGTTECISVGTGGQPENGASGEPVISADGRFVAFSSTASNLVAGDTNSVEDVFVRDRLTAVTRRVSVGPTGQGNGSSSNPSMTGDGRFVAFMSMATNLAQPAAPNAVYVRDRTWNTTETVSISPAGGVEATAVDTIKISDDGRFVVYRALGTAQGAVHLRDRGITLHHPYCTGDGAGFPCPCGNQSTSASGAGCRNSLGTGGLLSISGAASLSADSLVLRGSGMPDGAALFLQGTAPQAGGAGTPFGDGFRCVGGQVVRLGREQNTSGASMYPSGTDTAVSVQGQVASPGSRFYQVWYRNADPAFCTSALFNLSNGMELIWTP